MKTCRNGPERSALEARVAVAAGRADVVPEAVQGWLEGAHSVGGENRHLWADVIAEACLEEPIHVVFPRAPHAAAQRLLQTLGATWSLASGPGPRLRAVSAIAPAELDTQNCNEPGCPDPAIGGRGPNRNKCPHHAAEVDRRRGEAFKRNRGNLPTPDGEAPSLQRLALALVAPAKALDRAQLAKRDADRRRSEAFEAFKAALQELSDGARQLLNGQQTPPS